MYTPLLVSVFCEHCNGVRKVPCENAPVKDLEFELMILNSQIEFDEPPHSSREENEFYDQCKEKIARLEKELEKREK